MTQEFATPFATAAADRRGHGKSAREAFPRQQLAHYTRPKRGRNPLNILAAQDTDRVPELIPIRYERMVESPFAFLRGSSAVMARDLAADPSSGLTVQLCGDAHLSNFGLFASPERDIVFDINDFDETYAGPFEWDVKRLAASVAVVGAEIGLSKSRRREAVVNVGRCYRRRMAEFARMGEIDVWRFAINLERARGFVARKGGSGEVLNEVVKIARGRDQHMAARKTTTVVNGERIFKTNPPLIVRPETLELNQLESFYYQYLDTLPPERKALLARYRVRDVARKAVGVGSVGTHCFVVLVEGRDDQDLLVLQVKEAGQSVLAAHLDGPKLENQGERVVIGQRMIQAIGDTFLGWMRGPQGRDFYWRQLWDMKSSIEIETMRTRGVDVYAEGCAWALARAHAKTGDAIALNGYLGRNASFEEAIADFAEEYAAQTVEDHAMLASAMSEGRFPRKARPQRSPSAVLAPKRRSPSAAAAPKRRTTTRATTARRTAAPSRRTTAATPARRAAAAPARRATAKAAS